MSLKLSVVVLLVAVAGLTRLLPHPANFAPLTAMALFAGAMLTARWQAASLTLLATWASDLLVNNILYAAYFDHFVWLYDGFYWQYGAYALIAMLSFRFLKNIRVLPVAAATLTSTLLFFVISNFGVWFSGGMYEPTWQGLVTCYVAALPFLKNALAGDLLYSALLFGGAWAASQLPAARSEPLQA